jgi:two-component system sensor histidine kinase PilS (NtrC family)
MDSQPTNPAWGALHIFNVYRLSVAVGLLLAFIFNFDFFNFAQADLSYFFNILWVNLALCLLSFALAFLRFPGFQTQVIINVLSDILVLTLLIQYLPSALVFFGILINGTIAGGSVLTAGRTSILFAAIATIAILTQQIVSTLTEKVVVATYTQVGLIGVVFFATAMLGYALSKRIRESEAIAEARHSELAKLQQINEYVVKQIQSGIIVVDQQQQIILMNSAAEKLLGFVESQEGKALAEVSSALSQQLQQWQGDPQRLSRTFKNTRTAISVLPQFISLKEKQVFALVILLEDISQIKQQAQQMKLAALGRLTASIAHEIRNPLSAVSYAAQLLEELSQIPDQEKRLLEIIRQHVSRMNSIVNNILDLSRRRNPNMAYLALATWLENFIDEYQNNALEACEIELQIQQTDLAIYVDAEQLRQVMVNLFDNGLRYSKQHTQQATLQVSVGVESAGRVFIDIVDHGAGATEQELEKMFEPFYTRDKKGTGLGLYIAKELCEANKLDLQFFNYANAGGCLRITGELAIAPGVNAEPRVVGGNG